MHVPTKLMLVAIGAAVQGKLLVGERVEVRSDEEGFVGSWHPGTVKEVTRRYRNVEYDNLLTDDESGKLVEGVHVSAIIDGSLCRRVTRAGDGRGIRPPPPRFTFNHWTLRYGQCVDVYYNDAWWEGVIFDHNVGAEERRVLFPDLGDELMCEVTAMRITQDWDESEEIWYARGIWMFLRLIEKYEQERYLPVSPRQIWYDVQEIHNFDMNGWWAFALPDVWENLIAKVIASHERLMAEFISKKITHSNSGGREMIPLLEAAKPVHEVQPPQVDLSSLPIVPVQNSEIQGSEDQHVGLGLHDGSENRSPKPLAILASLSNEDPVVVAEPKDDRLREVEMYVQNINASQRRAMGISIQPLLRELGWDIREVNDGKIKRKLYISPTGDRYKSLLQVCQTLLGDARKPLVKASNPSVVQSHVSDSMPSQAIIPIDSSPTGMLLDHPHVIPEHNPQAVIDWLKRECGEKKKYKRGGSKLIPKVKGHLAYLGYRFKYKVISQKSRLYIYDGNGKCFYSLRDACKSISDVTENNKQDVKESNKQDVKESNKQGEEVADKLAGPSSCNAVTGVWQVEIEDGTLPSLSRQTRKVKRKRQDDLPGSSRIQATSNDATLPKFQERNSSRANLTPVAQSCPPSEHARKLSVTKIVQKCTETGKDTYPQLKAGSHNNSEEKNKSETEQHISEENKFENEQRIAQTRTRAAAGTRNAARSRTRSRAGARQSKSGGENPLTLLSWLIDEKVILIKDKVIYSEIRYGFPFGTGRVTPDGIRCDCCRNLYTIINFEAHMGKRSECAANHIFLEDGRSMLECQLEALNKRNVKNLLQDLQQGKLKRETDGDDICLICHFGGDLLLCERCPNACHYLCIGLQSVPEGSWYCPSCSCRSCGGGFQNEVEENLICAQCDRKYHVQCIQGETNLENNWFCSEKCQEIFSMFQNISGKPIPIGLDDLTLTFLQPMQLDNHAIITENAFAIEVLCKLEMALSVMHECFEPCSDPETGRDISEDVIFTVRTEIGRWDFRGFYTILLQKGEEVVTAANIRIFGKKLAELPFVGTRFKYRRNGMCRILMTELEKMLIELGVERLILPAAESVVDTWINRFEFAEMEDRDTLDLVDFIYVNFQGTTMCQKMIPNIPPFRRAQIQGPERQNERDGRGTMMKRML